MHTIRNIQCLILNLHMSDILTPHPNALFIKSISHIMYLSYTLPASTASVALPI